MNALPVDNEPWPFWIGDDQEDRILTWQERVGWKPSFGQALSAGRFNGSSGRSLHEEVLVPLGIGWEEVVATDCLPLYHMSEGVEARVADTYDPFARKIAGPAAHLPPHPRTATIVREAERHHNRIRQELLSCRPEIVITLGEAAMRVFRVALDTEAGPPHLRDPATYGTAVPLDLALCSATWYPLVHPGNRNRGYRAAHAEWMRRIRS